ncbi:MAG: hypothetical protein H6656_15700 [Ardenticatenaceae bacterium]|nr:hypothetical protein [Ardenticatenaceae bacterium]
MPEIPQQFETRRLLIRCPQPGDRAALYEAILASKDHLSAWLSWADWPNISPKRAEASILRNRDRYLNKEDMTMLIFLKKPAL